MAIVDFQGSSLAETLEYMSSDGHRDYQPKYEADEKLLSLRRTFTMEGRDVTRLEVVSKLAETFDADILISPGRVTLKERIPAGKE